ncbi:hypothetical protein FHS16_001633 [Paenibacillus endophyticus]|uniref:Intracellular proteinase inhibitor BsuPI domain-containing protein n=1 Tax=Paenibacillus endophyticus TaxID=1294268 RepID=A0A7W5GA39_9BACL|nr:hypothetical protein [Paenibacillus endophyticus]MBB3151587.1 hypothetical protein [Paenibacillus endophyticus]
MKKLVIILFFSLLSCHSIEPESIAKTILNSTITSSAEKDLFSVHISVQEHVKTNEAFTIKVEFKNEAERIIEIMSGEPLFYFVIWDSTGKAINTIARTDVGVVRPLSVDEVITEKHLYEFKKRGIYEVSAIAEFTLQFGDDSKFYKLETVRKQIKVNE